VQKIDLSSQNKTKEFAYTLSKKIKIGDIIYLYGEIGVGKTTFVKFFINSFQKKNNLKLTEVISPTFTLLNEYQINKFKINHYDLFRLESSKEIDNLDLFTDSKNSITLIEWPQKIKKNPKNLIKLEFNYNENYQKRSVEIKGLSL
tara:strand:+ start:370 stop:807 length:438 start_codon:yes stop_codon:yes gene_type:complete